MTVSIGKPGYMSAAQLKELSERGHVIGAHTYDHPLSSHLAQGDWDQQLLKPKLLLEKIIQKPVNYFAYPFGSWSDKYIQELKRYNYKAAFQLSGRTNTLAPEYTIKRVMVTSDLTPKHLHRIISSSFR